MSSPQKQDINQITKAEEPMLNKILYCEINRSGVNLKNP